MSRCYCHLISMSLFPFPFLQYVSVSKSLFHCCCLYPYLLVSFSLTLSLFLRLCLPSRIVNLSLSAGLLSCKQPDAVDILEIRWGEGLLYWTFLFPCWDVGVPVHLCTSTCCIHAWFDARQSTCMSLCLQTSLPVCSAPKPLTDCQANQSVCQRLQCLEQSSCVPLCLLVCLEASLPPPPPPTGQTLFNWATNYGSGDEKGWCGVGSSKYSKLSTFCAGSLKCCTFIFRHSHSATAENWLASYI
jgi:hypothetical protein